MKEERRRKKQMEANYEEDYFEDHGGRESTKAHIDVLLFPFNVCMLSCRTTWEKMFFILLLSGLFLSHAVNV